MARAWAQVGVAVPGSSLVRVSRSGGFAGRSITRVVDLDSDVPVAAEVRELLGRVQLGIAPGGLPKPDMFVYTFEVLGSAPVTVSQQELSPDLARLAGLVLEAGGEEPM